MGCHSAVISDAISSGDRKKRGMILTGPHSAGRTAPLIGFETAVPSKQDRSL